MSKFMEALKGEKFQKLVRTLADGETKDIEAFGIKPDIAPLMKQRLDIFAKWYDAELSKEGDTGTNPTFLTDIQGIPFTAEELKQIDDVFFTEEILKRQLEGV